MSDTNPSLIVVCQKMKTEQTKTKPNKGSSSFPTFNTIIVAGCTQTASSLSRSALPFHTAGAEEEIKSITHLMDNCSFNPFFFPMLPSIAAFPQWNFETPTLAARLSGCVQMDAVQLGRPPHFPFSSWPLISRTSQEGRRGSLKVKDHIVVAFN